MGILTEVGSLHSRPGKASHIRLTHYAGEMVLCTLTGTRRQPEPPLLHQFVAPDAVSPQPTETDRDTRPAQRTLPHTHILHSSCHTVTQENTRRLEEGARS